MARLRAVASNARFARWEPEDPGLSVLRRAARAAIVIPTMFALVTVLFKNVQVTTFLSFGCFALLVMADFGGLRPERAAAYVTTTLLGGGLVILGTLVSPVPWAAAALMFLVGFCIQFVGVFGSYLAAAQTALLLAFVLPVSVPISSTAVGDRLLGWAIAGVAATLSGLFFWPLFERLQLRSAASEACSELAAFLAARRGLDAEAVQRAHDAARAAIESVREEYRATPKRPAGPARRDRAFVELLTELERALDFSGRSFGLRHAHVRPCLDESARLAAAVEHTLQAAAGVLVGSAPPDLPEIERARASHRQALDRWAAEALRSGMSEEDVLAGLDVDHELRVISYLVLSIGTNATIAAGVRPESSIALPSGTPLEGATRPLVRIVRTIRTHLTPSSGVFRQSVRVGFGLALAVLLARLLRLDHAFWVVLGTLTVLRSNAFGTGRTTLEALLGTVIGFAVGAGFTIVAGNSSPVLWAAFPLAVFLAAYASGAIGFVVGQAGFTLLVIILFNLLTPIGWRVGLARIEDVAAGVGVSVVVGFLLWPRGARGEFGLAVGGLYRAVAAYLAGAFNDLLQPDAATSDRAGRLAVVRAQDRAGEAFDRFAEERGTKPLALDTAAELVAAGSHAIVVGDLLRMIGEMGYRARDENETTRALRAQTQLMLAGFLRLADRLEGATSALLSGATVSDEALRAAALSALQRWRQDPTSGHAALAAVIAGEWLQQLGDLSAELELPVDAAVAAARLPWWR